jgi:tetratricopeptide (TPR) repeat protein
MTLRLQDGYRVAPILPENPCWNRFGELSIEALQIWGYRMRRGFFASAILLSGTLGVVAADDMASCSDQNAHKSENIAACGRAIASGQFSGAQLRNLYLNRGQHWFATREADRAFADFNQALALDPKNGSILEWVFLSAVSSGRVDDGAALAKRIVGIDKNHRISRLVLGVQSLKQKQYAAALPDLRQSVRGQVTDLLAALLSGWASYGAGDIKAAVSSIDRLGGPNWYGAFKDFHAGLILDLANRQPEAGARFERVHKLEGADVRVPDGYARWLSRNRDLPAAIAVYEAADRKLPNQPLLLEGLREVRAGGKLPPLVGSPQAGAAEALLSIGSALTRDGKRDFAQVYLQLAVYLLPGNDIPLESLAELYETSGKPQLAIEVLRRISTGSPQWRNAQIRIATALDSDDRPDEAARMLRSLIADDAKDVVALLAMGNIERNRKKFVECVQTFSSVIDLLPEKGPLNWTAYFYRGSCRERSRQFSLAEADLRKALELKPDEPNILNYLGYSLIDQGMKVDEALAMIQRAVAQMPDNGYVVDSLGWAYFRTGNYPEAEKHLRRAAELVPSDPSIRQHLGDVLWRLGRRSQARADWSAALQLKPEASEAADLEDRIRNGLPEPADGAPAKPAVAVAPAAQVATAEPAKPVTTTSAPARAAIPAGRRVALVIGNSEYRSVPVLANPRRDSKAIADTLRQVGFQSVTLVTDATRDKTVEALKAFATEADKADWALIYYAGHGIEVGGLNYLIPVDAKLASDRDVQYEAINIDQVMGAAEGASKLRLVLLDACRDNPFANAMKRSTASRSVGRGLAQVEPDAGMLLVYAAKHGQVAFDGDGQNSPFVSSFIKRITTPQVEIRKLFDLVRDDVMSATKRQQQPFTYGSVPGSEDFYFLTSEVAGKP